MVSPKTGLKSEILNIIIKNKHTALCMPKHSKETYSLLPSACLSIPFSNIVLFHYWWTPT